MSAHAIGNDPEADLRHNQVIVFIVLADAAFVAHAVAFKGECGIVQFAYKRFPGAPP
jgi:hypothetical protein